MPFVAPEAHLKPRTHKSSVGFAFVFAFFVFWEKYTNLQQSINTVGASHAINPSCDRSKSQYVQATPDIPASLLLLPLSSHTTFPFHTSLLPCPRDLLSSLRAALVVRSSARSRCLTRDVDCTIAFRLPVRTSAKFVLSLVSAPFVCLVACFAPSCLHCFGRVCVVLLLQVQQQTRAPDSVFEVRTLPVPGSSLSRIALFSDWNLSSIQQLFRPDCASLCKRLDFEPRVLPSSSSARSCAPSTRPVFWCSTWARRAGGAGGA
jgi:hypothetical protein